MNETAGIQFLDLSMNFNPGLCDAVCTALQRDKYVSYVNLEMNNIEMRQKVLRKTDSVIKFNKNTQEFPKVIYKQQEVVSQSQIYLPVYLCTQINAIEQSKKELDPYEAGILKQTVPNYQNLKGISVVQLLQCYADDQNELNELMQMKQHPVVELLLTNNYITYFNIGNCNESLKQFVNTRLTLNRQTLEQCIKNNCALQDDTDLQKSIIFGLKSPQNIVQNAQNGVRIRGKSVPKRCSSNQKETLKKNMKDKFEIKEDENLIKLGVKSEMAKTNPEKVKVKEQSQIQQIEWRAVGQKDDIEKAVKDNKKVYLYRDYKKPIQKPESKQRLLLLQKQIEDKEKELQKLNNERQNLLKDEQNPKTEKTLKEDKKIKEEDLFNVILNAAYELIMEKSGKSKLKALNIFNKNQDQILSKCEDIMNQVKSGQMNKEQINGRLKQIVAISE